MAMTPAAPGTLRSNLPVGSSRWAVRRAQWRALGLTDEDMTKPKIAVVNSSSGLAICFSHLDGIVGPVSQAIRAAGGVAFEVRTAAPSDFITSAGCDGRYILPSRDLIVNDIEVAVEGALLDGMVCLASCDKTAPGQLMAAARLNIPTIVIGCGYQPTGRFRGDHVDIEEVFLAAGHAAAGRITRSELAEMSDNAVAGPGVCAGMGTANSMHIACEALGMAMPGSTPVLANSAAMWEAAGRAGSRIVRLVTDGVRPRDILTTAAFENAVTVLLSASGSVNTIKHLQAVAAEAGLDVDVLGLFERLAGRVPLLAAVRPNGAHTIAEFDAAGGTAALMKQLAGFLHLPARTVAGETLGTLLDRVQVADPAVIRPVERPFSRRPSIFVVRGSLCPQGAVVKRPVGDPGVARFTGPAVGYPSRDAAVAGLHRGEIRPGHVVVLAGLGPRGGPGMALASALVFALDGAGLAEQVAVVSDGQMSGLVNVGIVVGEVSPEAAVGGPLGLVEDGDVISIDLAARRVDLHVADDVLATRRARLVDRPAAAEGGWLSIYQRLVSPASAGAILTEQRRHIPAGQAGQR
jgi:dihydroxy-acid dehydratase